MKTLARILPLAATLGLASAAWAAKPITDDDLAALKLGTTTYDEVVARFGKPVQLERSSDGTRTLTYTMIKTHTKLATFVPVVGLFAGGAKGSVVTDRFSFGPDGRLSNVWASDAEIECGIFGGCGSAGQAQASAPLPASVSTPPQTVAVAAPPAPLQAVSTPSAAPPPAPAAAPVKAAAAKSKAGCIRVLSDPSQNNC